MESLDYFGRNGFINSDFWSPVGWLIAEFWPLVVATIIANGHLLARVEPWKRIVAPLEGELLRMHLFVVFMPFIALAAWSLFGEQYHTPTILALMAMLFLLPKGRKGEGGGRKAEGGGRRAEGGFGKSVGGRREL